MPPAKVVRVPAGFGWMVVDAIERATVRAELMAKDEGKQNPFLNDRSGELVITIEETPASER